MTHRLTTLRHDDRGVALILTVLITAAASLVAASLITLSISETRASQNYRMMTQARYAAESGVHQALNYLMYTYTAPASSGSDLLSNYTTTGATVTYSGNPVYLSSDPGVTANYADSTKSSAFASATAGTLTAGQWTLTYNASAKLTSMRSVVSYGGASSVVQTWLVTANGGVSGSSATVQVTSTLERQVTSAASYTAFATASVCGALNFGGNSTTGSYDSTALTLSAGLPVTTANSGSLGSNGNLTAANNVTINGSYSSPRTGVGTCASGNPNAETLGHNVTVSGGLINLGQTQTYTTPVISPVPPTTNLTIDNTTTCASLVLTPPATCSGLIGNLTINPNGSIVQLGNVTLNNNAQLNVSGGTYNINSLTLNNNAALNLSGTGNVVINVQGASQATPILFSNNTTFTNSSWDPSRVQFVYPGTGTVQMSNNSAVCAVIFAPNATVNVSNNGNDYGSIIGATMNLNNNGNIYYDRSLSTKFVTVGNYMLSTFNWKKY